MLYYERIDISKGIDPTKSNNSKECIICCYWFFNRVFKFEHSVGNGCYDLTMLSVDISNIAIISTKGFDYLCIIHDISKSKTLNLLKKSLLKDCGYV